MNSNHSQQRHDFVSHNSRFVQYDRVYGVLRASFGTLVSCVRNSRASKVLHCSWTFWLIEFVLKNAAIASTSISQIPEILARCAALNIQAPFLVLDNCRIHHSDEVVALFTFHGVDLLYLPPYSPDFNPIENSFSKFKLMLKRHGEFLNSAGYSDYEIIDAAFEFITPSDCANWIRHAGY